MSAPLWVLVEPLDPLVLVAYYGLLAVLSLYGVHRLWLLTARPAQQPRCACSACCASTSSGGDPSPEAQSSGTFPATRLPRVTVQLPLYNEPRVAARLIEAAAALDYPSDLLEIQVLDDSTDHTSDEVARAIAKVRHASANQRPPRIEHLRRQRRVGYKAGALAFGSRRALGELFAIFDADFVPPADFLRRVVAHFEDPEVGMVQARWGHLNRRQSLLTRLQAIFLDGHFLVEHRARYDLGCLFNFNGTAGVWRREAIERAGGWQHDTLTEDLDLSYRSQLNGWKFVFDPVVVVPAELPSTARAFRTQQRRWTRGSTQTLRKLWRPLTSAELTARERFEAFVHLSSNLAYPLLVMLCLLMPWAALARHRQDLEAMVMLDVGLLLLASGALAGFYAVSQRRAGRSTLRTLALYPAVIALGVGMSVSNAAAALGGLFVRGGEFVRTPKSGQSDDPGSIPAASQMCVRDRSSGSRERHVLRPRVSSWIGRHAKAQHSSLQRLFRRPDPIWWASAVLGVYLAWATWYTATLGAWWFVPFEALFASGLLGVCALQLEMPWLARRTLSRAKALQWRHDQQAWQARGFEGQRDDSVA